jgi:hypothetical protein
MLTAFIGFFKDFLYIEASDVPKIKAPPPTPVTPPSTYKNLPFIIVHEARAVYLANDHYVKTGLDRARSGGEFSEKFLISHPAVETQLLGTTAIDRNPYAYWRDFDPYEYLPEPFSEPDSPCSVCDAPPPQSTSAASAEEAPPQIEEVEEVKVASVMLPPTRRSMVVPQLQFSHFNHDKTREFVLEKIANSLSQSSTENVADTAYSYPY